MSFCSTNRAQVEIKAGAKLEILFNNLSSAHVACYANVSSLIINLLSFEEAHIHFEYF